MTRLDDEEGRQRGKVILLLWSRGSQKGAIGPEIYAGQGVEVKGFVMRRQDGEWMWKLYVAVFMAQLSSNMV